MYNLEELRDDALVSIDVSSPEWKYIQSIESRIEFLEKVAEQAVGGTNMKLSSVLGIKMPYINKNGGTASEWIHEEDAPELSTYLKDKENQK
jgi:hypothetical protein